MYNKKKQQIIIEKRKSEMEKKNNFIGKLKVRERERERKIGHLSAYKNCEKFTSGN